VLLLQAFSQNEAPFPKFGKITVNDLEKKLYPLDSHAKAVVLQDVGSVSIEGNSKGWFSLVISRHKIVHIINKNGYSLADVEIPLYKSGNNAEERISAIKGSTYNLVNGKLEETKMDKSNLFTENVNKNKMVKKFTMPNVKEGSIIEYEYKVTSDFIRQLDPWIFQEEVPVLWSEFTFSLPGFFTYAPLMRGYLPLSFADRKERTNYFSVRDGGGAGQSQNYNFSAPVTDLRWVMKDVPALHTESFTSSILNHISRMEFQMMAQGHPLNNVNFQKSWFDLTKMLMESEDFGAGLKTKSWVSDDIKPLFASISNEEEKAKKIFGYVRDNYTSIGNSGIGMTEPLKNIIKNKKGAVSDLNLLLAGLLRYHGLDASPVILSTTGNGFVWEAYPNLKGFNYVVVLLKINGKDIYLDASKPQLGYNYILPYCYNGMARVIGDDFREISLNANTLQETSQTMVIIANDEKGKLVGKVRHTPGLYESYQARNKIKDKGAEAFFKEIEKEYGPEVVIQNTSVDSLKHYDLPVTIQYDIDLNLEKDNLLYVNPMFNEGWKKNPFTSLKRSYPVEMPYMVDETFLLTLEVPAGYEVDELPKQLMLKIDEDGSGFFEYRISHSGSTISFRSRLKMNKAFFMPEEYDTLREFMTIVVKKHNEQIVFKKKK
jgi:hypothetical protein